MPWNTFWTWFLQIALAITLLSPFAFFLIWMIVGGVTTRLNGMYEHKALTDHAAGKAAEDVSHDH